MQHLSALVALADCRFFHDLWGHLIPIFLSQYLILWFQSKAVENPCYHLFVEKHPLVLVYFFSILECAFFAKWPSFFFRRVHRDQIMPLDRTTLHYQWNTAISGQKPGEQVKQTCNNVCFLNIKRTNSSVSLKRISIVQCFDIQSFKLSFLAGGGSMLVLSLGFR